jgi:hypothetical protein
MFNLTLPMFDVKTSVHMNVRRGQGRESECVALESAQDKTIGPKLSRLQKGALKGELEFGAHLTRVVGHDSLHKGL